MKATCEGALKKADAETKKLAAERNMWFAKYNKLVRDLDGESPHRL